MSTEDKKEQNDNGSNVRQSLLISFGTALLTLVLYNLLFQPLANINKHQVQLSQHKQQLEEIKETIKVSRAELEKQVKLYIDENYGELSERDEKIAKLEIYFKQQDARLSNIEEALSKF